MLIYILKKRLWWLYFEINKSQIIIISHCNSPLTLQYNKIKYILILIYYMIKNTS